MSAKLDMPLEGESLDILVDKWYGTYAQGVVKKALESDCRFAAKIPNSFPVPPPKIVSLNSEDWIVTEFLLAVYAAVLIDDMVLCCEDLFTVKKHFLRLVRESSKGEKSLPPETGSYEGKTKESDGTTQ